LTREKKNEEALRTRKGTGDPGAKGEAKRPSLLLQKEKKKRPPHIRGTVKSDHERDHS